MKKNLNYYKNLPSEKTVYIYSNLIGYKEVVKDEDGTKYVIVHWHPASKDWFVTKVYNYDDCDENLINDNTWFDVSDDDTKITPIVDDYLDYNI